jgi:hypothetical protein
MEKPKAGENAAKKKNNSLALVFGLIGVVAIALILWLLLVDDGDDSSSSSSGAAEIVSVDSLEEAAEDRETPIYWAGERVGAELELSEPDEERVYVRYLTDGAEAGDPQPDFLTIGTYANPDAVRELRQRGNEPGGVLAEAPGGATVYFSRSRPESVYLAYPGDDVEIEVYDPDFKQALQLVNSGQIVAAE